MKINKEQIESYIPQRAPFIMIDHLVVATPDRFETDFTILEDNIFLDEGILREFALIENIAQTSAVGLSYTNSLTANEPVEGFIGAISKLKVYDLPKINDTIQTIVRPKAQLGNMFLLTAENFVDGKKLLECEVKLVGSTPK